MGDTVGVDARRRWRQGRGCRWPSSSSSWLVDAPSSEQWMRVEAIICFMWSAAATARLPALIFFNLIRIVSARDVEDSYREIINTAGAGSHLSHG